MTDPQPPAPAAAAHDPAARSRIADEVARLSAGRGGDSGLQLLDHNLEAFAARAMLARLAARTLDLQYYYWRSDLTGRLLLREVLMAADRGVRVRLLLDDFNTGGRDGSARTLTSHPNIEVRYFNPSRNRESAWRRNLELLFNVWSATRRMHNKAWIADESVAIVGGRNIGDPYFDAGEETNFTDLDILAVGPAVGDTAAIFERYWQSEASIVRRPRWHSAARLRRLRKNLNAAMARPTARTYLDEVERIIASGKHFSEEETHWASNVAVIADPPEKAAGRRAREWIADRIFEHLATAKTTLNIISPYFIPGREGVEKLRALVGRGVTVSVLTNSLASTDVAIVHGGYAGYRRPMLEGGVRLHELKAEAPARRITPFGSSAASLHTKAYTVDGTAGFVGSYNFDPRSRSINTEMGILFEQPDLARRIDALFAREIAPANAYALSWEDGRLRWRSGEDPSPLHEPGAGLKRRLLSRLMGWLPFEGQM